MEITDFSKGRLWAISPSAFEVLAKEATANIDAEVFALFENREIRKPYTVRDGVAVIPVSGPLSKRESFMSFLFGGMSYAIIQNSIDMAVADPSVDSILLSIDSPGGTVSGLEAAGNAIRAASEQKPVIAFASGMMTSAAYWLASAADRIIAESTAEIGSIGVLMCHYDFSEMDKADGLKRTYLAAGKYKAIGNDAEPLGETARQVFQDELDYLYGLFVETVAKNRGVSNEEAAAMADGKVFIGQQALTAGLIDEVGSLNVAMEIAVNSNDKELKPMAKNTEKTPEIQNADELTAAYPDFVKELMESAKTEGIGREKDRIMGLIGIQFGADAGEKIEKLVASGVTVDQFAAIKALEPKVEAPKQVDGVTDETKSTMLAAIQSVGAQNPGANVSAETEPESFEAAWKGIKKDKGCSTSAAIKTAIDQYPELYKKSGK